MRLDLSLGLLLFVFAAACGESTSGTGTSGQGGGAGSAGAGGSAGSPADSGSQAYFRILEPFYDHVLRPGETRSEFRWSTTVWAISADGTTAVGTTEYSSLGDATPVGGDEAFRWTEATGTVGLGFPPNLDMSDVHALISNPRFVNADGSIVVGSAGDHVDWSSRMFRWTPAGMVDLGVAPGAVSANIYLASADLSVLAGAIQTTGQIRSAAVRWTSSGWSLLGTLPNHTESSAAAISADGRMIVGWSGSLGGNIAELFRVGPTGGMVSLGNLPGSPSCRPKRGTPDLGAVVGECGDSASKTFRWTEATGTRLVPTLPGYSSNRIGGVSVDGAVVVGDSVDDATGAGQAFRWTEGGGTVSLGQLAGSRQTVVEIAFSRISTKGDVIAGTVVTSAGKQQAFRWSEASGLVGLSSLPGDDTSAVHAVSEDGSIVVGASSVRVPSGGSKVTGVFWDAQGNVHSIAGALTAAGIDLHGFEPSTAFVQRAGGRPILYGQGEGPSGRRGWIATLP